ncbi:MAG: dUTP diphosphatase [Gemmatimonadota bacterium]|nr:dUTP diphosphatase [Gemmatimonadota bacterium]MDH3367723.1 dUTP diphosphatase [Gemmatimonadota bacterium]MDH3477524.1 dUTP diphosphatase [Gemmatimonadota bacterium]MDH3568993.1 dUTP diphosphatase [Gemmatimonadota bacterium]MDH5549167.1 dUTP diphosphatase [Gemmatimonadota bacterium]
MMPHDHDTTPPAAPRIIFEPLHEGISVPTRQTDGAAGYDVRADLAGRTVTVVIGSSGERRETAIANGRLVLEPGDVALVPTGFRARVPTGFEAQIRIRSSVAFGRGLILPNAPGTIDSDYPDEWLVMVKNDSLRSSEIRHGERIAQVILTRFAVLPWERGSVGQSTDRNGGLGSTGIH